MSDVRVNIGGGRYVSVKRDAWEADRAYSRGNWGCLDMASTDVLSTGDDVAGTDDPVLFRTIRMGEMFRYRFDLGPGKYLVRILFAEIYWETRDAEYQDVYLNGHKKISNYNIFDEVGHDVAIGKEFRLKIGEEGLELKFIGRSLPMHSGARACAIEVLREG